MAVWPCNALPLTIVLTAIEVGMAERGLRRLREGMSSDFESELTKTEYCPYPTRPFPATRPQTPFHRNNSLYLFKSFTLVRFILLIDKHQTTSLTLENN